MGEVESVKILTAGLMQAVDRTAIEVLGVPGLVLMENAALGVVDALVERWPKAESVVIFCGPGNNGGDGLAVGRHLEVRGYRVRLELVGQASEGDAHLQAEICRRMGMSISVVESEGHVERALHEAREADLLVDAIFGTGLTRPLSARFASLVEGLNTLCMPLLAVDLPSGLDASKHLPIGPHIRADLTVTFAAPKIAQVMFPAADAVGDLVVTDLGIPPALVEDSPSRLHLIEEQDIQPCLSPRKADTHKGTYGHLLVVAGGPGKSGAAVLAARAAVRSGVGLITVGVPSPLLHGVDQGCVESMTLELAAGARGELDEVAGEAILRECEGRDAMALGPGLGTETGTVAAIRRAVLACPLPLVLDADGLNAFAGRLEDLATREGPTVLTPHPGELARLLGVHTEKIQEDRIAVARRAAEMADAIVILKGHQTLVAESDGNVWVNPTGNPGMATGGSGDVLTGIVGSFLARGLAPIRAALAAVYLHGLAGDLAAERVGEPCLAAGDLIDDLPAAFDRLGTDP